MATPADEIAVDIDALDAEATKKAAEADKSKKNGVDAESVKVETAEPHPAAIVTPEEGVKKLQKQLEDEKTLRLAAEARANDAAQGEAAALGDVQKTQLDLVKGAIERLTQASDALEAKYAEVATAQDWTAAAKVQREMATNAAQLAQLEAGKTALEKAPKPAPRTPVDPVDQFCSQLSAPSAAWVRAHPEFVRDGQKNREMIAAHELAIARGYKADTPEYFGSIEKTLDVAAPARSTTKPEEQDDDPMADAAKPANGGRTAAPAAAPVSRSGNGAGGRPNVVKLSPAEVEIAASMGMTPEEYARNKLALKKEGKLS